MFYPSRKKLRVSKSALYRAGCREYGIDIRKIVDLGKIRNVDAYLNEVKDESIKLMFYPSGCKKKRNTSNFIENL